MWQTSGLENAVGAAHIRGMVCLDEYLTADEFNALEEVDEGRNRPIPKNLSDRLVKLGYIQETPKGLRSTSPGQMRLALGK